MKMENFDYIIWQEGEHFVSKCLNVEVSSFGNTKKEALEMLKDALRLYFQDNDNCEILKIENPELGRELINA